MGMGQHAECDSACVPAENTGDYVYMDEKGMELPWPDFSTIEEISRVRLGSTAGSARGMCMRTCVPARVCIREYVCVCVDAYAQNMQVPLIEMRGV